MMALIQGWFFGFMFGFSLLAFGMVVLILACAYSGILL
jgi:hypothetical protein